MSQDPAYPRPYVRPAAGRPRRATIVESKRSNAAVPVVIVLVAGGLYLGQYSLAAPALFGLVLLVAGGSFLSTRLNPLSPTFYLTRKPSWFAVGVVFLGSLILLADTYFLLKQELGGLAAHF